jgi:hypothetical protein
MVSGGLDNLFWWGLTRWDGRRSWDLTMSLSEDSRGIFTGGTTGYGEAIVNKWASREQDNLFFTNGKVCIWRLGHHGRSVSKSMRGGDRVETEGEE